jgi:ArsR family transcriptional regulator
VLSLGWLFLAIEMQKLTVFTLKMEEIGKTMPVEEEIYDVAELFKVLGDQTRVKILFTLIKDEMCVCDIAELLEMSQSAISHQLRVLKQARLVKYRREGKTVYYSVSDEHVAVILNMGIEHISE